MDGVVLQVGEASPTRELLEAMGFKELATEENRIRFHCEGSALARTLDLEVTPAAPRARSGNGVVHHIAFRARDTAHQQHFHDMARERGLNPSPVMDRHYFRSIYFRSPGGVLFEVATDAPGFAVDESIDHLGESLCLPPSLEFRRTEIEKALPPLG